VNVPLKLKSKSYPIKIFFSKIFVYLTTSANIFIKFLKKYWFYLSVVLLVILFFINRMISIISSTSFAVGLIVYYLISSNFKYTLINFMNNYQIIEDRQISEEMVVPLEDVRKYMRIIAKKQKKRHWMVVSIKSRCVFYNVNMIDEFIDLYNTGLNEKNIFNTLNQNFPIKSRAEIKAIGDNLIERGKINKRDLTQVKLLTLESEFLKK